MPARVFFFLLSNPPLCCVQSCDSEKIPSAASLWHIITADPFFFLFVFFFGFWFSHCVPRCRCPNRARPRSPHLPVTWRSGAKGKQGLVSCWCNSITASSQPSLWSHRMSLILSWVTPVPNPRNFARHSPETHWITQVLQACSDMRPCETEQRGTILNSKSLFEVKQRGRQDWKKKQKGMKEKEEKHWCLSRLAVKGFLISFHPSLFPPRVLVSAAHSSIARIFRICGFVSNLSKVVTLKDPSKDEPQKSSLTWRLSGYDSVKFQTTKSRTLEKLVPVLQPQVLFRLPFQKRKQLSVELLSCLICKWHIACYCLSC